MKIGICVFAYHRDRHLARVLEGLKQNEVVGKVYFFQDGINERTNKAGWDKTKDLIDDVDWCEKEVFRSQQNMGLAASIVYGITKVLKENDAVVVLEDDCIPMPGFISFMKQAFEKYKNDKKIYCVSGYGWPVIPCVKACQDAYFCGRISSWGWGTWKDRWMQYEQDYTMVRQLKKNQEGSERLAIWGNDLEEMLLDRVRGNNDSWAVFWALKVIVQQGFCVNPYKSLIHNIGMDGTGEHCGVTNEHEVYLNREKKESFVLPEQIHTTEEIEKQFAEFYNNYTVRNVRTENKMDVVIYGLGKLFFSNEREINERFYITGFIDANKKGYYAGYMIKKIEDIKTLLFDKILICMNDRNAEIQCARCLVKEYGISFGDIIFVQEVIRI